MYRQALNVSQQWSLLDIYRLPARAATLLHGLSTVNIAYIALLHGIDLQTETHITGTCSKVKKLPL
jgi:hypothetical protein